MSSSPQDQNQESNQEPSREPKEEEEQKDGMKAEVKVEEKQDVTEKRVERKEVKESWTDLIYNRRTREFLGRTASSWGLILLFYLVFYGFLAGMFTLTMWVMLQTLDDNVPRYQDRITNPVVITCLLITCMVLHLVVQSSCLAIRPHAAEITFNRSDPTKYIEYTQQLHTFLQQYNDSLQESNELCMVGEHTEQDDKPVKKVCQFKRSTLHQCSGLPDTSFGYAEGKPCVIIKMNRVVGLKPEGDPYINCNSKRDTQLQMEYFPTEGRLDKMFFPYYGKKAHPDYVQPVVAIQLLLTKQDYNIEQTIECKVEGSNLRNDDDRDKFMGRVTFRVKVSE